MQNVSIADAPAICSHAPGVRRETPRRRGASAPAGHRQCEVVVHEHASRRCQVTRLLIVTDGFDDVTLLFVPGGRGAVQRGDRRRRGAPQFEAQQIAEQVVIAKPGTGASSAVTKAFWASSR